jgi:hypothetical protein
MGEDGRRLRPLIVQISEYVMLKALNLLVNTPTVNYIRKYSYNYVECTLWILKIECRHISKILYHEHPKLKSLCL